LRIFWGNGEGMALVNGDEFVRGIHIGPAPSETAGFRDGWMTDMKWVLHAVCWCF